MLDNTQPDAAGRRPNLVALSSPDPEVSAKPTRRRFSADYKARILKEIDACTEPGQVGAICRREGLYSSLVSTWRRQREKGLLANPPKRGRQPNPEAKRIAELEKENRRLQRKLHQTEAVVDALKKISALLEAPTTSQENGGSI